jgi:alginate O-acetyltransferase complex protein AlgI
MRPVRSFLLLLLFLAVLTGLHYVVPVSTLFPAVSEFVSEDIINSLFHFKNTSEDKTVSKSPVLPASTPEDQEVNPGGHAFDTISSNNSSSPADTIASNDSLSGIKSGVIANPLDIFLDSLRYSKGQVRVMYYGDSQIEGDRITSYLRQTLRKGHGGTGPGLLLPLMPVMFTKSVWIRSSANWKKYNYLSYKSGELSHNDLGPFMAICRYLPEGSRSLTPVKASVTIRPSNVADSLSSAYDHLRIFYGNTPDIVRLKVRAGSDIIFSDTLQRGSGFYETGCYMGRPDEISIEFEGTVSPDLYGISIESKTGIIVDNIPQRGSAGLEFTMVSRSNLQEVYRTLKPDLFILHYGLNIVKNVREDYTYFQKGLERQLLLLREVSPSTPILVMSVTDMAEFLNDTIRSYRNIPAIIEAQRHATRDAGTAFWNSYKSMGGESSIIKWAERNPPLAQKDYVHFTYPGADTLSKILSDSLFSDRIIDTGYLKQSIISPDTIIHTVIAASEEPLSAPDDKNFASAVLSALFRFDPDKPMIFTTAAFWIFFLIVLGGYSLVYKKMTIRNVYLFLISLFFYYKAGGLFLFILIFVTLVDYSCGLLLARSERRFARRFIVFLSLFSNLGLLAYFKYTGFISSTINEIFGTRIRVYDLLSGFSNSFLGTSFDVTYIILPVGISFFTFQSLSYIIDLYRRKMDPVRNIIDFGFYVSFFPHLVAGPIVRASVFIPQIYQEFRLNRHEFSHAIFMISKGLIKKIIISNFIAVNLVDRVFDAPYIYSGFENLMAIYGYGLQIYCDFSGYTDIAIGVALIIGFRLPINFYSPYKAVSITDFWKRWHISLSQWLRDYVYISLGGNRTGKIRTYINVMITMLLGGLWHGASLKYIIWGGLHGTGLIINKVWNSAFKGHYKPGRLSKAVAIFITFNFVSFCWIFFRAPDIASVGTMINQIVRNFSPGSYMAVLPVYSNAILLIIVGYAIHLLPEKVKESYRGLFIQIPVAAQMAVIMAVAILLFQMRGPGVLPFIYFRF